MALKMTGGAPPKGVNRRDFLKFGACGALAAGIPALLPAFGCRRTVRGDKPNIILITLDTTRADHLGCYGYRRRTSPAIDALAGESVLYEKARAASSETLPSHASLLTGKITSGHGVRHDPEGPLSLAMAIGKTGARGAYRVRGLARDEATLPLLLKEQGYRTGAAVAGPWLRKVFSLGRGFDFYDDGGITSLGGRPAPGVTDSALPWIADGGEEPFFLLLNYFDPHRPYRPPVSFAGSFVQNFSLARFANPSIAEKTAFYDAEILFMDYHIGLLFHSLKKMGLYDGAMIIVTADHGELLGEHGRFGHGSHLFEEELHVPLILKYPRGEVAARRLRAPILLTDVFALILERLGAALPPGTQSGPPPRPGHPLVAEAYPPAEISGEGDWRAIYEGRYKALWNSRGSHRLYDLEGDPREEKDLSGTKAGRMTGMLDSLAAYIARIPAPGRHSGSGGGDTPTGEATRNSGQVGERGPPGAGERR